MSLSVVKVLTSNHFELFYTGPLNTAWLCEEIDEAFSYANISRAQRVADRLNGEFVALGLRFYAVECQSIKN